MWSRLLIMCLLCGALAGTGGAQGRPDLKAFYDAHQWFELRDALASDSGPALYHGAVAVAFNQAAEAEAALKPIIKAGSDSEADEASEWLSYMYVRSGRYRQAAAAMDDSSVTEDMLASLPDQSVRKFEPCTVSCRKHQRKLFIPGSIAGKTLEFFIDSDANFSFMSESETRSLGLSIHESNGHVYGATGNQAKVRVSVADELTVGNIELKNVTFLVLPDTEEVFRRQPLHAQASLGVPVLLAFRTLQIDWQAHTVEIGLPSQAANKAGALICFDGVNPIAVMDFQRQHLPVVLDTGAAETEIWPLFAKRFADLVNLGKSSFEVKKALGGEVQFSGKVVPELKLGVGGFDALLRPAHVLLGQTTPDSQWYYGRLGLDVLQLGRKVTIDFDALKLTIE